MILVPVTGHNYRGACRYTGYEAKSIELILACGHELAWRKASAGVPKRARCIECERKTAKLDRIAARRFGEP